MMFETVAATLRKGLYVMAAIALPALAAAQSVPHVIGPIPADLPPGTDLTHSYPQLASEPTDNLSSRGYVEEEFFFQGTATSYATPALADGVALSTGLPYKSRMIVRRPADPSQFNGVVLVEWVNVTSGYNLDLHWQASREYLTRHGYAYVGVSAQRVGVQQAPYGLTEWSPTRYGTLDVTAGGTITDDSLSYDIFSQAGRAIRSQPELLAGLRPRILIAIGASQSASRLTPYYNSIQPLHRVYDGFLLHVGGGPFRTDISTKLLRINTEREIVAGQAAIRQPDSNIFRSWEIAGASHVDYWYMTYRQALVARDELAPFNYQCDKQPLSHVNNKYVLNAGYDQLVDWILRNRPPSVATPIVVTSVSPTVIPRDTNGLVSGGIRLATVEVPTATNDGVNGSTGFCNLYGSHTPFPDSKVQQLYPNHQRYVDAVREVTQKNLGDGFIVSEDAAEIIDAAEDSTIGTNVPRPVP
jgi:Alpha/beta hydrolase domain